MRESQTLDDITCRNISNARAYLEAYIRGEHPTDVISVIIDREITTFKFWREYNELTGKPVDYNQMTVHLGFLDLLTGDNTFDIFSETSPDKQIQAKRDFSNIYRIADGLRHKPVLKHEKILIYKHKSERANLDHFDLAPTKRYLQLKKHLYRSGSIIEHVLENYYVLVKDESVNKDSDRLVNDTCTIYMGHNGLVLEDKTEGEYIEYVVDFDSLKSMLDDGRTFTQRASESIIPPKLFKGEIETAGNVMEITSSLRKDALVITKLTIDTSLKLHELLSAMNAYTPEMMKSRQIQLA